ncbi:MAG TPA: hypothetical protein DEB39_15890 [Planctomycetaceae bacterium]|nr:hypothetical protein [Planctomycetaceae bacterium]
MFTNDATGFGMKSHSRTGQDQRIHASINSFHLEYNSAWNGTFYTESACVTYLAVHRIRPAETTVKNDMILLMLKRGACRTVFFHRPGGFAPIATANR